MDEESEARREPSIAVRRSHALGGVEVWSMFNWLRPGCYSNPALWFSMPSSSAIHEVAMRHDGRLQTADGAGLLVVAPGEVCVIERLRGRQPLPGERTLVNLALPVSAVEPELWLQLQRHFRCEAIADVAPAHALQQVCRAIEQGDEPHMRVDEMLQGFLACLLRASGDGRPEPRPCSRALKRAQDFIHSNWNQSFSLETLADVSGVSKWHLTRTFSNRFGVTPSEYARVVRARHALDALRAGSAPARIATELGYSDQAHLTRELQRLYGMTPSAFRKAG